MAQQCVLDRIGAPFGFNVVFLKRKSFPEPATHKTLHIPNHVLEEKMFLGVLILPLVNDLSAVEIFYFIQDKLKLKALGSNI